MVLILRDSDKGGDKAPRAMKFSSIPKRIFFAHHASSLARMSQGVLGSAYLEAAGRDMRSSCTGDMYLG